MLDDAALENELDVMTDSFTDVLAARAVTGLGFVTGAGIIAAPVSRLAVDVERFPDEREVMNDVGMGAVYTRTHDGAVLREQTDLRLVERYGDPHARVVADAAGRLLESAGAAVLLDVHSYPSRQQPYEIAPEGAHRPEICLGVDDVHTPPELLGLARAAFTDFEVAVNTPFAGTYVPLDFYGSDRRVSSLMIEIRRDTYMDEERVELHEGADKVVAALRDLVVAVGGMSVR